MAQEACHIAQLKDGFPDAAACHMDEPPPKKVPILAEGGAVGSEELGQPEHTWPREDRHGSLLEETYAAVAVKAEDMWLPKINSVHEPFLPP